MVLSNSATCWITYHCAGTCSSVSVTSSPQSGQQGGAACTALSQDALVGREVERPAGMAGEPLAHHGVLVGGAVVDDDMDRPSLRHLRFDGVEEAYELLMPMACMLRPMTVPSANSVVVPWRL